MLEKKNILSTKRPRKQKRDFFDKELGENKQKEIADKIALIYEDQNGKMPDMKKIKLRRRNPLLHFILFLLFITSIMAVSAWAGFFYFPQGEKFSEEKINLTIEGPQELELGGTSTYKILITNDLSYPLNNVTLNINYPEGFIFKESDILADNLGNTEWSLSDIPALSSAEINISGQNFGSLQQQGSWRVFLNYKPGNLNSQMQKIATLNTKVSLSPFTLSSKIPERAAYGSDFEINYKLENKNNFVPEKMYLALKVPDNFFIVSATPALDTENRWVITPTSSDYFPKNFKLIGRFNGELETTHKLLASLDLPILAARQIYQIGKIENEIALSRTAYLMNLAINGTMSDFGLKPGDPLNITLSFKNAGKTSLKNASLALKLDAPALQKVSILDWPEITDTFDGDIIGKQINDNLRNGTVTWNKSKIKELTEIKPNQEINVDLKLPIKDSSKIKLASLKESIISAVAEITFTDDAKENKIVISNPVKITINSDFTFEKKVNVDKTADNKDKRDLTWILRNNFHPLKNIELTAEIYGDVDFVSTTLPTGVLTFEQKEKVITWKIENMPGDINTLIFPFSLIINKKNPSQQVLVSKIKISAEDTVTKQTMTFMGTETLLFEESADSGETVTQFFEDIQQ